MGREFFGVQRTTFVIYKKGRIRAVYPRVKVKEHTAEVLGFIRDEFA
jgi:peroxiredoxin Q/BCP